MRGTDAEFAAYVRARQLRLLRAAHLVCGDARRAEAALQHAFLQLALHWDHVRTRSPDAYVRRILYGDVHRETRPYRRARRGGSTTRRDGVRGRPVEGLHALPRTLRQLTPRQRAVVVLRFFEERSEDDTADVLDLSVRTVRSEADAAVAGLAPSGQRPAAREITDLLEIAGASVREVDLADRAWHGAAVHRATFRRRAAAAVSAVALVVMGAGLVDEGERAPFATAPPTTNLTPVPRVDDAAWRTSADGSKYVVAPTAGTESTLPHLETGLPTVIDPAGYHYLASVVTPGALSAFGDAVYLEQRSPGRWVPVIVWGNGDLLTVDSVELTDVHNAAGEARPPLGVRAFSGDKTAIAFAQPGGVVVFDVASRTVETVAIPSETLEWVAWTGKRLMAGSSEGTWRPGGSPDWTTPEPARRPGAREYRLENGTPVLDEHLPDRSARPTPVGWPLTRPYGETVSDADHYASAFLVDDVDGRGIDAVRPRQVIVAAQGRGRQRMLVFGEEQPRAEACCPVLGWTVHGDLIYLSSAPTGTWIMAWDLETGRVHRVTEFLTSETVPPVIALGVRFTVG